MRPPVPHGNHQPPAQGQLLRQGPGHLGGAGGDDDGLEGHFLGPTQGPVPHPGLDVGISQLGQNPLRLGQKRRYPVDGKDLGRQLRQDGRLITRTGADFEHLIRLLEFQHLGHQGHDIGLRDGLVLPDGQGIVAVGLVPQGSGDKVVPGHLFHGRQHPGVGHPPSGDLSLNHPVAHGGVVVFTHRSSSLKPDRRGRPDYGQA